MMQLLNYLKEYVDDLPYYQLKSGGTLCGATTILVRAKPGRLSMEGFDEEVDCVNHSGRAGLKIERLADWGIIANFAGEKHGKRKFNTKINSFFERLSKKIANFASVMP